VPPNSKLNNEAEIDPALPDWRQRVRRRGHRSAMPLPFPEGETAVEAVFGGLMVGELMVEGGMGRRRRRVAARVFARSGLRRP